jgi:VWFA-related protein
LTAFAGATIFDPAVRAQDGVAGAAPVYSTTKKQPAPSADLLKQAATIKSRVTLVTTPVAVIDSSGQFVYGLDKQDFEILDNGTPQQIENFETEMQQAALVVVIETNSKTAPLLDAVRPLASMFSSLLLGAQGQAAVIIFNDRVRVAQDFSNDSDQLAKTFKDFTARGDGARLNDALARAIGMLEQRPKSERRVIVAFSDGFDSGSETARAEIVRRATTAEVGIYGLGFSPAQELLEKKPRLEPYSALDNNVAMPSPPNTIPTPTNVNATWDAPIPAVPIMVATGEVIRSTLAKSLLEYYSGYTGGVFYSHWSGKALQEQLNRIATEIQSQYELAYIPDTHSESGFHRIEVHVNRAKVKVRARAGYFNPEKSP